MKRYRVICTDSYGRSGESPGYDEYFITMPLSKYYSEKICELLNYDHKRHDTDYYRVVPEDYVLQKFEV